MSARSMLQPNKPIEGRNPLKADYITSFLPPFCRCLVFSSRKNYTPGHENYSGCR